MEATYNQKLTEIALQIMVLSEFYEENNNSQVHSGDISKPYVHGDIFSYLETRYGTLNHMFMEIFLAT